MEHQSSQIEPVSRPQLKDGEITSEIIGSFFDVYNALRFGYLEATYGGALAIEMSERGLCFQRECPLAVSYKGHVVGNYRADFVVEGRVIVELKSIVLIGKPEKRQLLNYLRATGKRVGLLLNFGPEAKYMRCINSCEIREDPRGDP